MLDARGVISVTDRTAHIARVRDLARKVAGLYLKVVGDGRGGEDEGAGEAPAAGAAGEPATEGPS
jgi:hypothetical protein